MVDYQDDGSFEECTDCMNLSYTAGIFTFNVSHFTEYETEESPQECQEITVRRNIHAK
jgi:hypothetical protein